MEKPTNILLNSIKKPTNLTIYPHNLPTFIINYQTCPAHSYHSPKPPLRFSLTTTTTMTLRTSTTMTCRSLSRPTQEFFTLKDPPEFMNMTPMTMKLRPCGRRIWWLREKRKKDNWGLSPWWSRKPVSKRTLMLLRGSPITQHTDQTLLQPKPHKKHTKNSVFLPLNMISVNTLIFHLL